MWNNVYQELVGRVYWYLCFSEEKGQLEDDLMHAILTHRHLLKDPAKDPQVVQTLEEIINVFSKRISELKAMSFPPT
jgi:hypothetical protein